MHVPSKLIVAPLAGSPAHPRSPRHFTAAVNINGALTTCSMAQEFWKSHPVQRGEGKRRLIILSSMGGISNIPSGVSANRLWRSAFGVRRGTGGPSMGGDGVADLAMA